MKVFCKFIFFLCFFVFAQNVFTQLSAEKKGIEFYEKGDYQNAISFLSKSEDVKELYYLGLSYEKTGKINKAQDAYKESFIKSYKLFFTAFEEWQNVEINAFREPFSDLLQKQKNNLQFGYASAENAYKLKSKIFERNEWRIKAKVLFDARNLSKSDETIFSRSDKTISPIKITEKPRASFPKDLDGSPNAPSDMRPNLTKTIKLFIVFGADGKIKLIMPTDENINSLTISSINSAEKIKFEPATKDDKSVTIHLEIAYSFTIG